MDERLRPQPLAPLDRETLSQFFVCELEANGPSLLINRLQVSECVKKYVVEHESADGQRSPFVASSSPKLLGRLTSHEASRQAHAGRQSTKSDLSTSTVDVAENARTAALIVEVDSTDSTPDFDRKTAQHDAYVFLVDVM